MGKIAKQLTELVGNTPLLELSAFNASKGLEAAVVAKLESFNPVGCVKERIALAMVEDAEAKGILKPGATIIEPTSGNTGVGLAFVAAVKGYKLVLTMPETMSLERRALLKALGAELVLTPGPGGMKAAIQKATDLQAETEGSVILQQFENRQIPRYIKKQPEKRSGAIQTAKWTSLLLVLEQVVLSVEWVRPLRHITPM